MCWRRRRSCLPFPACAFSNAPRSGPMANLYENVAVDDLAAEELACGLFVFEKPHSAPWPEKYGVDGIA